MRVDNVNLKNYRPIEIGEILKNGDLWREKGTEYRWSDVYESVGKPLKNYIKEYEFIRPIKKN